MLIFVPGVRGSVSTAADCPTAELSPSARKANHKPAQQRPHAAGTQRRLRRTPRKNLMT